MLPDGSCFREWPCWCGSKVFAFPRQFGTRASWLRQAAPACMQLPELQWVLYLEDFVSLGKCLPVPPMAANRSTRCDRRERGDVHLTALAFHSEALHF